MDQSDFVSNQIPDISKVNIEQEFFTFAHQQITSLIEVVYEAVCKYLNLDNTDEPYEVLIRELEGNIQAIHQPPQENSKGEIIISVNLINTINNLYAEFISSRQNMSLAGNYILYNRLHLLIHCLIHEIYHRYQYITDPSSFDGYIDSSVDYELYKLQNTETEANRFAGELIKSWIFSQLDQYNLPLVLFMKEYLPIATSLIRF